jgi:putative transposase
MSEQIKRIPYASDLSDKQWEIVEPYIPTPPTIAVKTHSSLSRDTKCHILFATCRLYMAMLPHDYPSWKTVYHYFRIWRNDGVWERMNSALHTESS